MTASFWQQNISPAPPRPALRGAQTAEVAVIGGGMAGILIAHRLAARGLSVAVVERARIGSGQTAGTTAKLTAQHGTLYSTLTARKGVEAARLYAAAQQRAVAGIRGLVREKEIACDFTETDAWLFSLTDRHAMEREAAAMQAAGLPAQLVSRTALPIRTAGAVRLAGQACFHPLKLLHALAAPLRIYENTPVRRVEDTTLICDGGTLAAERVVFACHYPFVNFPGWYFTRLHQERSYVLALRGAPALEGMYLECGGGLSLRRQGEFLLLGGSGHRTGEEPGGHYAELRTAASTWFPEAQETACWSAQDGVTPDGLPYIGVFSPARPHWYVAAGFGKWGMSNSMAAANLLSDLIGGYTPPDAALFAPDRPAASLLPGLAHEGGHAVRGLSRGWIHRTVPAAPDAAALPPGEGGVFRLHGQAVGLYHAPDGSWYGVNPRCPHLGCALEWNPDEKTWDCPCHGSRFDYTGRLLNNPAGQGLAHKKWTAAASHSHGE